MIYTTRDYIRFGWQLVGGWRLRHERWIAGLRCADLSVYENNGDLLRILDLANGQLQPQYRILRAQRHHVYGIDIVNRPAHDWRASAYRIARRLFARNLHARLPTRDDALICGEVSNLPLRDGGFDLVTSVAAFEHFLDVPAVLKETHRVLRVGGFVWALVHLFSSPSGGHNISLSEVPLRTVPPGIDPWDHLRKRHLPFHVPLNEWRKDQYLSEFRKHFEILKEYCALREGEHFLTPGIERELSDFNREELTCGAYVIFARKTF
jgi:SAM-dependent methyltransferase